MLTNLTFILLQYIPEVVFGNKFDIIMTVILYY